MRSCKCQKQAESTPNPSHIMSGKLLTISQKRKAEAASEAWREAKQSERLGDCGAQRTMTSI